MLRGLAVLPFLLLGLALAITLAGGTTARTPQIIAVTAATVVFRFWWQFKCPGRARVPGFVVNMVLTLVLVSLHPLYGVYAFVGYLDAVAVFSGVGQVWALVAAASLNALAQSGGPGGARDNPGVFAFLLVANAGLALVMVRVDRHRQRTVTRLEQALADLEDAQRVNEALQDQIVDQARTSGVLEERHRLSREIHDTVAQGLVALIRHIEAATEAASLQEARTVLERADRTARDSLGEARRAVAALASPWLDESDLPKALGDLVARWNGDHPIDARFRIVGHPVPTAWDAQLLRVCQEGLANVAKHSRADRVDATLTYADTVTLVLHDDGVGFAPDEASIGHGIDSMQARLAAAGGQLEIQTSEGRGCTVRAAIPL